MGFDGILKESMRGAVHLLFPRLCEGCRQPLLHQEQVLCMGCIADLPQTYFHDIPDNEAAARIAGRIPFEHATSIAYFTPEGLLQHLLHRLKYSGRKPLGMFLGQQAGYALQTASWIRTIDAIVPVPLHPRKLNARGFNQSILIAEGMADVLNIPVVADVLKRERHTASQTRMSREERVINMKDAFRCEEPESLAARHILLIDDVLTTGATLESAWKALSQIPSLRVSICTIGLAKD